MTISQFEDFLVSNKFIFEKGIWYSPNSYQYSYPEDGHDDYFQIEEKSFWFQHRSNSILTLIKMYSPNNLFFDIGGGNGLVAKAIENAHISSVLVEPGIKGVENASKRNISTIFCGTLNDISGLAGNVGAIGAFDVIEHIKDDTQFADDVYKMLFSGGYFFVTVPAFKFLWSRDDQFAGHFRRYNLKSILNLLVKSGFKIEYSTYFFSFLLFPLFLIRTIPSKLGLRGISKSTIQSEHKQNKGILGKFFNLIWNWELRKIRARKYIPFGTSCLIVAKKI